MKNDSVYLHHILDAIQKIESYVVEGKEVFMKTSHWQDAVVRQLEIIGEAAKKISTSLRDQHAHIPWKKMAGFRDVLIHDYMGIDLNVVWETTQQNLPELKEQIKKVLSDFES